MNAYLKARAATDDAFTALQRAQEANAPQGEIERLRAIMQAAYARVPIRPHAPF